MVRVAGLEPASPDWKSGVLPTATKLVNDRETGGYSPVLDIPDYGVSHKLVRSGRIELPSTAWHAVVLPLNDIRKL